jgi:hypothetical protein
VNANIRSANRTAAALGALVGGAAVAIVGDAWTLVVVMVVFAVAALVAALSPPLRGMRALPDSD